MGDEVRMGRRIARYRDLANMTQRQLGEAAGVGQSYVAMIERGSRRIVSRDLLAAFAEALRVPVGDLIGAPQVRPDGIDLFRPAVAGIRAALDGIDGPGGRSVARLATDIESMQIARMGCDYVTLARVLPGIVGDCVWHGEGSDDPWLAGMGVRALVNTAIVVRPLGYLDLAVRIRSGRRRWRYESRIRC